MRLNFAEATMTYPEERRDSITDKDPEWKKTMVDFLNNYARSWGLTDKQIGVLLVALEVSYCLGHGKRGEQQLQSFLDGIPTPTGRPC